MVEFEHAADLQQDAPLWATIVGEQGVGKTTLASLMPNPIIFRIEDGVRSVKHLNPAVTPVFQDTAQVGAALKELELDSHGFRTLVIDSISKLASMVEKEICAESKVSALAHAEGGYGAGYNRFKLFMARFGSRCEAIREKQEMNVIYLCHAQMSTYEPEDADPYQRLDLRLDKRGKAPFVDDPDLIGFIRLKRQVKESSKNSRHKIATSGGTRELICYSTPACASKNRLGIDGVLNFKPDQNPLEEYVAQ